MQRFDVVVVGAGHGGAQAVVALRQKGFSGSIALIGDEPELPYERPPLSKDYLSGEKPFERILIRPARYWAERSVDLLSSTLVTAIDPVAHTIAFADGGSAAYGHLIWSAGGRPRRLSCAGHDLAGIHYIRTRADVDRLMAELPFVRRAVVVGGGYIGLEAAAVLRKLDRAVTLVEALDRVLARVAGEPVSHFFEAEHRAHGVDLLTGHGVDRIEGDAGRVTGVRLTTGAVLPADVVIVGIGIIPSVGPLVEAGAAAGNGVEVDEYCRTTLADVYAIGDCAAHRSRFAGGQRIRLESVQNANDMAATAAAALLGEPKPYTATPWFWSNQYDLKLQTVGLSAGHDRCVLRGDPAARSFSAIYVRDGRVIALDCINAMKDYVQGRRLVEAMAPFADAMADPAAPLAPAAA